MRKHGSGNLGGTNAIRVLGKPIGFSVAVLDVVKAGLLVFLILNTDWFDGIDLFHPLVYGFASVIGHVHPIWFKFKGGKGVATTLGLLMAYQPFFAIAMILLFFLVEYFTRIVSVSSTVAVISSFFFSLAMHLSGQPDWALVIVTFLSSCRRCLRAPRQLSKASQRHREAASNSSTNGMFGLGRNDSK
ncbi:MAG: glycerol-3-phosphate acyltransferase [Bacillus subtilis]|nr:glycerol-3-phosphate acyltransferase [Bacillus subtilis]